MLADYEKLLDEVHLTQDLYEKHLFEESTSSFRPEVLLAETELGNPLGFALFVRLSRTSIHLEDLFVDPVARGKGVGISLLSSLASLAIENGVNELQWNCLDWNQPSIDFYHSLGAVQVPNRLAYRITGESLFRDVGPFNRKNLEITSLHESPEISMRHIPTGTVVVYSLSFTTFNGTPVIYVTDVRLDSGDTIPADVVNYLIHIAQEKGFSRVDVCLNTLAHSKAAENLIEEYGAIGMEGWIPFRLRDEPLRKLAKRT